MAAHDLTKVLDRIIACAREVGEAAASGLELAAYEAELDRNMRGHRLQFARQYPVGVPFMGPKDRGFRADFIVEGRVLLELAQMHALDSEKTDLALNYLRESRCDVCLLINFDRTPVEIRRVLPSGEWRVEAA